MANQISEILSTFQGEHEFQAVLPPSKVIAKIIASIANTGGGALFIGINKKTVSQYEVVGISGDFHINSIVNKAISFLEPQPDVRHKYTNINGKQIYILEVYNSDEVISLDSNVYVRQDSRIILKDEGIISNLDIVKNELLNEMYMELIQNKENGTYAKKVLIDHYIGVLKIFNDLYSLLSPRGIDVPTDINEGKILSKILFSSAVDNFELYLSQLLYEIYLAKPQTLKSKQEVTVEEVLRCSDMDEFIQYIANEKISKLQKGSVKGFISDNKQISSFKVISNDEVREIEKILQIRHLYTHKNGIIDEKFLTMYSGEFDLKEEHLLSIKEYLDKIRYLFEVIKKLDLKAIQTYNLSI